MHEAVIKQRLNNGSFIFQCPLCTKKYDSVVIGARRRVNIKCRCGQKYMYEFDRRHTQRTPHKGHARCDIRGEIFSAQLCDVSRGGIGCCGVPLRALSLIAIGDPISVTYRLCGDDRTPQFVVRAIVGQKIGLQFADGLPLSPAQRSMIGV